MDAATAYLRGFKTAILTGRDRCADGDPGASVFGARNRAAATGFPVRRHGRADHVNAGGRLCRSKRVHEEGLDDGEIVLAEDLASGSVGP